MQQTSQRSFAADTQERNINSGIFTSQEPEALTINTHIAATMTFAQVHPNALSCATSERASSIGCHRCDESAAELQDKDGVACKSMATSSFCDELIAAFDLQTLPQSLWKRAQRCYGFQAHQQQQSTSINSQQGKWHKQ
ncbi:hypothetical protein MMC14_010489 [Varicellaria rhodocarpa]|nr:hypothetical protein [Varicellaria rhodocarpa]